MKKINNKGFTLVELLAVLVILIAIMGIAIPTISSSLERTKANQNEARYRILESAAEQYVTDNKNNVYINLNRHRENSCFLNLNDLSEYLSSDDMKDAGGNDLNGVVIFTRAHTNGVNQVPISYEYVGNGTYEDRLDEAGNSYRVYIYTKKNEDGSVGEFFESRDCTS